MERETVSHGDLRQDIGGLKVGLANVEDGVRDLKSDAKEREKKTETQFAAVNAKLDTLLAEREQRRGMKKLAVALYTTLGGLGGGSVVAFLPKMFPKLFT